MEKGFGHRTITAFGFAFDIERTNATASGFRPAETDLGSGENLFGNLRLTGFNRLIETNFAQELVIIGGDEKRYAASSEAPINRATAICEMLKADFGTDPMRLRAVASEPNTNGNVEALRRLITSEGLSLSKSVGVSSHYHIPRIHYDLMLAELPLPLLPAESFILFGVASPDELAAEKAVLFNALGRGSLAARVVQEIAGIAAKLNGTYLPMSGNRAIL